MHWYGDPGWGFFAPRPESSSFTFYKSASPARQPTNPVYKKMYMVKGK